MAEQTNDYAMTLFEACEYLNKSSRTISRYIRRGVLRPMAIKSRQGTLEYRFSKMELEAIKKQNDEARQLEYDHSVPSYGMPVGAQFANVSYAPPAAARTAYIPNIPYNDNVAIKEDEPSQKTTSDLDVAASHDTTGAPTKDKDIISLLKETTDMLRGQLQVKDDQIKALGDKIDQLIERGRETNILLKGMQDKMLRLGQPAADKVEPADEIKLKEVVVADVPASVPQAADLSQQGIPAKPKKRAEKDLKEKNSKSKVPAVKKTFLGRLFG